MNLFRKRRILAQAAAFQPLETRCLLTVNPVKPVPVTFTHFTEGISSTGVVGEITDVNPVLVSNFTAIINWGDGTTTTGVITQSSAVTGLFLISGTHAYQSEGAFAVTATVHDTATTLDNVIASTVTVDDAPLTTVTQITPTRQEFSGVGGTNTAGGALNALNAFEASIGGIKNTAAAPQTGGFRAITWDGVAVDGTDFGGNNTVIVPNKVVGIPVNRFETQGAFFDKVYAVSSDGFKSVNSNVNAASPALFPAFSPTKTFAMFNGNTINMSFVQASGANVTAVPASTSAFGAIFFNVRTPSTTSIEYFRGSQSLGKFFVPVGTQGQAEFLGELFIGGEITNVSITLGTAQLFGFDGTNVSPGAADNPTGGSNLVVTDDFVYAEPASSSLSLNPFVVGTDVGTLITAQVATFRDANANAVVHDFTASIDWGDGSTSPGTVSALTSGFGVNGSHSYRSAGTHTITTLVQDFGGSQITLTSRADVRGDVTIDGTSGNDTLVITQNNHSSGALFLTLNGGSPLSLNGITSVTFDGHEGTDTLSIDAFGAAGLSVPGRLTIANQPPIFFGNVETINFNNSAAVNNLAAPDTADRGALTGLTGNNRFVQALYLDDLGRAGGASELAFWSNFLTTGGTRAAVIAAIDHSAEARTRLVRGWYAQYLGRQAFNNEEQPWVTALVSGQSEDQVLSGILSSAEFFGHTQRLFSNTPANAQFVQSLYRSLLNRDAPDSDVTFWSGVIASSGVNGAVQGILGSGEFRINDIDAIFVTLLHRHVDPGGSASFFGSTLDLAGIRETIETSDEFFVNG